MQKRMLTLGTGGTIASSYKVDERGRRPVYSTEQVLNFVPRLYDIANITIDAPLRDGLGNPSYIDSSNMQPENSQEIARKIFRGYREGAQAVVVLGGTDTMEEYAAYLASMLPYKKIPVVVTGSMEPIDQPNSDGINNISNAVKFAALGISGTYIVFDKRIIAGSSAKKMDPVARDAFTSISFPEIGTVTDSEIKLNDEAVQKVKLQTQKFEHKEMALLDRFGKYSIHLLELYMGFNPWIIDMLFRNGYKGLIIEAFGTGGVPGTPPDTSIMHKIEQWRDDRFIGITSQTFRGQVTPEYEVNIRAQQAGAISLRDMLPKTAVAKATWAFGQTDNVNDVKKLMLYPFENEINGQSVVENERTTDEEVERILKQ